MTGQQADAFVFFAATGDLAFKKIFPALQAMVKHGRLTVPVIGVGRSAWTADQLRDFPGQDTGPVMVGCSGQRKVSVVPSGRHAIHSSPLVLGWARQREEPLAPAAGPDELPHCVNQFAAQ